MKVLIVYATRTGSAAKAAELPAGYFSDARVSNLENENPDQDGYDVSVFTVYYNTCSAEGKDFLQVYLFV